MYDIISLHPLVSRGLKATFNERPPRPKYGTTHLQGNEYMRVTHEQLTRDSRATLEQLASDTRDLAMRVLPCR